MPNIKSLSLTVQKLWPRLTFLTQNHRQTGQKLDAPEFHSRGIKTSHLCPKFIHQLLNMVLKTQLIFHAIIQIFPSQFVFLPEMCPHPCEAILNLQVAEFACQPSLLSVMSQHMDFPLRVPLQELIAHFTLYHLGVPVNWKIYCYSIHYTWVIQ